MKITRLTVLSIGAGTSSIVSGELAHSRRRSGLTAAGAAGPSQPKPRARTGVKEAAVCFKLFVLASYFSTKNQDNQGAVMK